MSSPCDNVLPRGFQPQPSGVGLKSDICRSRLLQEACYCEFWDGETDDEP